MASFEGGAGSHGTGNYGGRRNYEVVDISSDSGSSYDSSRSRASFVRPCPFQTDRFHDQECSRYFDCPTHTIERVLVSDDEAGPNDDPMESDSPWEENGRRQDGVYNGEMPRQEEAQRRGSGHDSSGSSGRIPSPELREDELMADRGNQAEPIDLTSPSSETAGSVSHQATISPTATTSAATQQQAEPDYATTSREIIDLTRDDTPEPPPQMATSEAPSSRPGPSLIQPDLSSGGPARHQSEVVLPRWQPDAEVTLCPICRTQFSFFVRKHHCRKCGRVVCYSCSPHRITIPYQYIVQPPEQPRLSAQRYPSSFGGVDNGLADFGNVGGGERVRLCNPCVPDPNITPPQPPASPTQTSPRSHARSRSNMTPGFVGAPSPSRFQGYFAAGPAQDSMARHRSVTHSGPGLGSSRGPLSPPYGSTQSRILAGTPPSYFPSSSSAYPGAPAFRYRSMLDVDPPASSSSRERALPPPPPQIAEDDECPVCHRELPSRDLPNYEALRESHITICISSHSAYIGGGTPTETPDGGAALPIGTPPPLAMRRTGMFPYVATEKDCVDSAECTICLEEFEVGNRMARLECLCRFHRSCISAWFINHPGRCPVHQHDSFGY